jgi:hypothetical protein
MSHLARTTTLTFMALAVTLALMLAFLPTSPPAADGQALVIDNARWFDGDRMQPTSAVVIRNVRPLGDEAPIEDPNTIHLSLSGALGRFDERLDAPEGLVWAETSDAMMGGGSTASLERVARDDGGALRVEASVTQDFAFPWAGAYLGASAEGIVGDLGGANALAFEMRGTPGDYRLMLFVAGGMGAPPTAEFTVGDDWRRVEIALEDVRGFEPDRFTGMALVTPMRSGSYGFEIDNVELLP